MRFSITGQFVDIRRREIYPACVEVRDGVIYSVERVESVEKDHFILPGFVDAHVHVESSMLVPSQFARLAVVHGTVGTVSDPHEIANVCGMEGVDFMINNGQTVPFKFCFGAPSCVPATTFETSGAELRSADVELLLARPEVGYLTEVMNFPGVLNGDVELLKKIAAAKKYGKPVDGHAPGLTGEAVKQYIEAGISTDHECFTTAEALEKLKHGMKVQIREGSAARNFEALVHLINEHYENMMFCSDDKHPDNLVQGHINQLCARAVAGGADVFKVLQMACVNPVEHYGLQVGVLQQGDPADFIVVEDLQSFNVLRTYIDGELVAEGGRSLISLQEERLEPVNRFNCRPRTAADFVVQASAFPAQEGMIPVIAVTDGQLVTDKRWETPRLEEGIIACDVPRDILKIAVVNRYHDAPVACAFITNFGLKRGALASSIAHDSHNIIAVGANDDDLCRAVNLVIESKGGVSLVDGAEERLLALPVAGLMSNQDGYEVARKYSELDAGARALGSTLASPYMSLSFMALLVIPELKLSDKGLFDGGRFAFLQADRG